MLDGIPAAAVSRQFSFHPQHRAVPPCGIVKPIRAMNNALDALLSANLDVKAGEHLAFIYDQAFVSLLDPIRAYCADHGVHLQSILTDYDGIGPLSSVLGELILGSQPGVILFGVVHNIWHTSERKKAKYQLGKRLASIVCSPNRLAHTTNPAGLSHVAAAARQLSALLVPGAVVRITSPAGSDFVATVGKPFCEHGEYQTPGSGGDFPAGEAGFGPQEFSVTGHIVYDVKVQHLGLLREPLALTVKNDRVVDVTGPAQREFFELCERRGDVLRYISEVSVGLNPFVGITPEPEFIPEEKTYGTAHCGHGGNASYGKREGAHIDGVIMAPTVEIDGKAVMESGKLLRGVIQADILDWLENTKRQ